MPSSLADEDIYDTPRSVPPGQADSESEVNKLPVQVSSVQTGRPFIFRAHGGEFLFFLLVI